MKERVTLTLDKELLSTVDAKVDGETVKNRSHAVELYLRRALRGRVPSKALILAGGKGTRLLPLTKGQPKALLEVQGKPLLEHNLLFLRRFGIRDVLISVGHLKEKIKAYCQDGSQWDLRITYVEEDEPLGTGGPLRRARSVLADDAFVVLNADELKDVNLESLYREHLAAQASATIALTTVADPTQFGVALLDGNRIVRFVEKPPAPAPSKLINAGLYILEPGVIDLLPEGFSKLEDDLFPKLAAERKLVGFPFAGQWCAPHTPEWLEKIDKEWRGFGA